jgi:hypothetical protein
MTYSSAKILLNPSKSENGTYNITVTLRDSRYTSLQNVYTLTVTIVGNDTSNSN